MDARGGVNALEYVLGSPCHDLRGVTGRISSQSILSEARSFIGVLKKSQDRAREQTGIAAWKNDTCFTIDNQFVYPSNACRHDRFSERHAFQQCDRR